MTNIKQLFLVTIEIDTEKAKPFPNGFKDPATNNGDNGLNWNAYPNWELNYQDCEYEFINHCWEEFRLPFEYDGLECQIFTVNSDGFTGLSRIDIDDKLEQAEDLIEDAFAEFYDDISLKTANLPKTWQDQHMEHLDDIHKQIIDNLRNLLDVVRETISRLK